MTSSASAQPPQDAPPPQAPGLRIATLAGVPVYIGRTWVLLALVILGVIGLQLQPDLGGLAYAVAAGYALLLLVAVLVHEAAHALAARACGMPVHRVVADLWGGHTTMDATTSTPGRSALVAVVGPLANLALAAVGYGVASLLEPGIAHGLASIFGVLNLLLAGFNLLPGLPLDGGQLVEALVWRVTGDRHRARVVAGVCGLVVTIGVLYWFIGRPLLNGESLRGASIVWALLIGFFLWQGARAAIRSGRMMGVVSRFRILDVLQPVVPVPQHASLAELPRGLPPVLVDDAGMPVALLDPEALARVPDTAHGHTPVSAVSRPQPPDWVVHADPAQPVSGILGALGDAPGGVVAIVHNGRLAGVVTVPRVNEVLSAGRAVGAPRGPN